MGGVIRHEAHKAFANAAQALEGVFSWRGVLRALRFLFLFFCFLGRPLLGRRFCFATTDDAQLIHRGEDATKIVTK
jgi:hypothetical protein